MRKLKSVLAVIMALTMLVTLAGTAVAGKNAAQAESASVFPAKYDARKDNIVTPVKDQAYYGNCWAQATISCLETDAIKNLGYDVNTTDFSENHLTYWVNGATNDGIGDCFIRSKFMVYYGTDYGLNDDNITEYHIVLNDNEELVYSIMFSTKEAESEATPTGASPADASSTDSATDSEPAESKFYKVISLFEGKSEGASPEDYEVITEYEITKEEIDSNPNVGFICMGNNDSGAPVNSLYVLILDYDNTVIDCVFVREGIPANYIYAEDNVVYLYDNVTDKRFKLGEIFKDGLKIKFRAKTNDEPDDPEEPVEEKEKREITIPKKYLDNDGFIPNSCENGDLFLLFLGDGYTSSFYFGDVFMDGFGMDGGGGGSMYMAANALAVRSGIANEKDDYTSKRFDSDSGLMMRNMEHLNTIDEVKQWVIDHGSVALFTRWANSGEKTNIYHSELFDETLYGANHFVTVVGWDDNYSKSNFDENPEKNGAWLVKNSHGTQNYDKGYNWISYESAAIIGAFGYSAAKDIYSDVYSYTGVVNQGLSPSVMKVINGSITVANVYEFERKEMITDVGIMTLGGENVFAQVDIFGYELNKHYNSITSGNTLAGEIFLLENPGYHTLRLKEGVEVKKGEKYVIAVTYYGYSFNDPLLIPTELPFNGWNDYPGQFIATYNYKSGQSYYKFSDDLTGAQWIDSADTTEDGNEHYGNFYINVLTTKPNYKFNDVSVNIKDYRIERNIKSNESMSFSAVAENMPKDAKIHWFVGEKDDDNYEFEEVGTGESYNAGSREESYVVQAKVINSKGTVLAESAVEFIEVELTLCAKIKRLFKDLMQKIKDFIDKILEKIPIKLNLDIKIKAD